MTKRTLVCAAMLFGGVAASHATLIIRELWDTVGTDNNNPPGLASYNDGISSLGFQGGANWQNHPSVGSSNALIQVAQNFDVNPGLGLPVNFNGQNAGLWSDVFWGTSDVNAAIPYNSPSNWAGRLLAPSAWIDFSKNGVYYFSLDLAVAGSGAGGMAIASDLTATNHFLGFGVTWPVGLYPLLAGGDAGGSLYVSQGSFGDPSDTNTSTLDAQGLYAIKAYGDTNILTGGTYLLVGRLTTVAGGSATLNVKAYTTTPGLGIETNIATDVSTVVWDATYTFTETNVMKYLVVFMNSEAPSYPYDTQGGLRVGSTWGEVVGVEALNLGVGPSTTVFSGQSVNFTNRIRLNNASVNNNNSGPIGYYYTKGGVPIPGASGVPGGGGDQNVTFTLVTSSTSDTGDYAIVATNAYGAATSPTIHITVNPSAGPSFLVQPQLPASRYQHGTITLSPVVQGTPPFNYQWWRDTTSLTGQTNLNLALSDLQAGDQGNYYLHVSNFIGATNSVTNLLTVMPASGYVAEIMLHHPFAHYELNETTPGPNTVLHDYAGGHDGLAVDTNVVLGLPGPGLVGFDSDDLAVQSGQNAPAGSRINVPINSFTSNMTFTAWVYGNGMNNGIIFGGDGLGYGVDSDGSEYFGMYFPSGNTLGSHWGFSGTGFNSGIVVPSNQWTFVSLVVTPSSSTIYMGVDPLTITNGSVTGITNGANVNTVDSVNGTCIGRTDYSWAGPGNAWAGCSGNFSQVSVFYSSLNPLQVADIYAAGVGSRIVGTNDGAGHLVMSWLTPGGVLQQASSVTGPYSDIPGAVPPYSVPMTSAPKFYRARR